jgi:hypothetical protein
MSSALRLFGRVGLALLAVVGLPQIAHADFINLVSQNYHVHGSGTGITTYDITSASPITQGASGVHINPITGNPDGGVTISTSADGSVTAQSAFVREDLTAFDLGNAFAGPTAADAAITFRPLVAGVVVTTSGSGAGNPNRFDFSHGSAQLYDETIGAAVFALVGIQPPMTYNFMLDLSHLYTLSVSQSVSSGGAMNFDVGANIAPVPESERTLTFFVVGLGALVVLARSRTLPRSNAEPS